MHASLINSQYSKAFDPHRLILNLSGKINLKSSDKYVASSNLSIRYTWEKIKKLYRKNKFKISTPTWNDKSELPDGSYSASDIQDYFE